MARQAGPGLARQGRAWHGEAGKARLGGVWQGMARQGGRGWAWLGEARRGGALETQKPPPDPGGGFCPVVTYTVAGSVSFDSSRTMLWV